MVKLGDRDEAGEISETEAIVVHLVQCRILLGIAITQHLEGSEIGGG